MSDYILDPAVSNPGHYFTIAELRLTDLPLENTTKFTDAILEQRRQEAEDDFEEIAHRAFVPRTATVYRRGGDEVLMLPHIDVRSVVSVTMGGVAVDTTGVEVDPTIGGLRHPSSWPTGLLFITYTHGLDAPPAAVKRAVLLLAKEYALPTSIPSRATVLTNDVGSYRISVADKEKGTTGIPDVDSAAARYGFRLPVVG